MSHRHTCPRCPASYSCSAPECAEAGTVGIPVICPTCAIAAGRQFPHAKPVLRAVAESEPSP